MRLPSTHSPAAQATSDSSPVQCRPRARAYPAGNRSPGRRMPRGRTRYAPAPTRRWHDCAVRAARPYGGADCTPPAPRPTGTAAGGRLRAAVPFRRSRPWSRCANEQPYDFERMSHLDCLRFSFGFSYCPGPPDELFGDFGRLGGSPQFRRAPTRQPGFRMTRLRQGRDLLPSTDPPGAGRADNLLLAHCQPGTRRQVRKTRAGQRPSGTRWDVTHRNSLGFTHHLKDERNHFHEHGPARGRDRGPAAGA